MAYSTALLLLTLTLPFHPTSVLPYPLASPSNITNLNITTPPTTPINFSAAALSSTYLPFNIHDPDPNYSTAYPGPIKPPDLTYYLKQFSPEWWRVNLDSLTATACLCSSPATRGLPIQIASYMQYDYYSHLHKKAYALNTHCGPIDASPTGDDYCWAWATGTHYGGGRKPRGKTYCTFNEADGQRLCVDWAVEGKRWMSWHGHRREFDRKWTHVWEEGGERVERVCGFHCRDKFVMEMDGKAEHGLSFVRTYYPPKPIPWD